MAHTAKQALTLVVYLRLLCAKDFNVGDLSGALETKGEQTFEVVQKRGARAAWAHKVYGGRLEYRPWEASSVIDVSIRGKQEDMLTGSFVEWVLRNVAGKIIEIAVYTP
jgi:hypothetical protein